MGDVNSIKELPDILGPDPGDVVKVGSRGGHSLDVVALKDELILDLRAHDLDARVHRDLAHDLLPEEVTDLALGAVVGANSVDGEMRVHKPHLVLKG